MFSVQTPLTTICTPNDVTYSYSTTPPSSTRAAGTHKPTILFLHGFPDDRTVWDSQVVHVSKFGYVAMPPICQGMEKQTSQTQRMWASIDIKDGGEFSWNTSTAGS